MSETLSTSIGSVTVGLGLIGTFGNCFSLAAIATQLIGNEGLFFIDNKIIQTLLCQEHFPAKFQTSFLLTSVYLTFYTAV